VTTANGDATLLLDAVSIVQRDAGNIVIQNPSFEATGVPSGVGYIQPDKFAGWDSGSGGWGPNITGVGPFTDNGAGPDQDMVAFLQGNGCFISQNVTGLTPNEKYTLIYSVNARACCGGEPTHYTASFAGNVLADEDIMPVGGNTAYPTHHIVFTATDVQGDLRFQHTSPVGDHTLLIDNVMLVSGDATPRPAVNARRQGGLVRLAWPASAATYRLQCAGELKAGAWFDVQLPVQVEGDELVVYDDPTLNTHKFYRLVADQ